MTEHREFYRKKVNLPGFLVQSTGSVEFRVEDLSVDGLRGYFAAMPSVECNAHVSIRLPALDLERRAAVTRVDREPAGGAYIGFMFLEPMTTTPAFPVPQGGSLDTDDDLRF